MPLTWFGLRGGLFVHTSFGALAVMLALLIFSVDWTSHAHRAVGHIVLVTSAFYAVGQLGFAQRLALSDMTGMATPPAHLIEVLPHCGRSPVWFGGPGAAGEFVM